MDVAGEEMEGREGMGVGTEVEGLGSVAATVVEMAVDLVVETVVEGSVCLGANPQP